MTDADYRDMAGEIRELIPLLMHPQAVADLRLLAARYERLADYLDGGTSPTAGHASRVQASGGLIFTAAARWLSAPAQSRTAGC